MALLTSTLRAATALSASLFDHAEDVGFEDRERSAFKADALTVVGATQALALGAAYGPDSPAYDAPLGALRKAAADSDALAPGDSLGVHRTRLEVVAAVDAMKAVTSSPSQAR